jgi:hypothetical protein
MNDTIKQIEEQKVPAEQTWQILVIQALISPVSQIICFVGIISILFFWCNCPLNGSGT